MKLDAKFITARKQDLLKRKDELVRDLNIDAVQVTEDDYDAKFPDFGDKDDENAAEVATFEKNLSMEKALEVSLFNVNKALKKVEEGSYGTCEKCSAPINPRRLEAFPSATTCMECKRKVL